MKLSIIVLAVRACPAIPAGAPSRGWIGGEREAAGGRTLNACWRARTPWSGRVALVAASTLATATTSVASRTLASHLVILVEETAGCKLVAWIGKWAGAHFTSSSTSSVHPSWTFLLSRSTGSPLHRIARRAYLAGETSVALGARALFNPRNVGSLSASSSSLQLYLLNGDVNATLREVLSSDQQLFDVSHDEQEFLARGNSF